MRDSLRVVLDLRRLADQIEQVQGQVEHLDYFVSAGETDCDERALSDLLERDFLLAKFGFIHLLLGEVLLRRPHYELHRLLFVLPVRVGQAKSDFCAVDLLDPLVCTLRGIEKVGLNDV